MKSPNALVISDPATSQIVRGMTGLNSTASRHPSISVDGWQTLQLEIKELLSPTGYDEIEKVTGSLRNGAQTEEIYIVLSKRTCWWSVQPNVWKYKVHAVAYEVFVGILLLHGRRGTPEYIWC